MVTGRCEEFDKPICMKILHWHHWITAHVANPTRPVPTSCTTTYTKSTATSSRKSHPLYTLPDILGTHRGIQALADFLLKSNVFTRSRTDQPIRHKPTTDDRLPEGLEDEHPMTPHNLSQ